MNEDQDQQGQHGPEADVGAPGVLDPFGHEPDASEPEAPEPEYPKMRLLDPTTHYFVYTDEETGRETQVGRDPSPVHPDLVEPILEAARESGLAVTVED